MTAPACPQCHTPGVADLAQITRTATAVTYHCPACQFEWVALLTPPARVP